MKSVIGIVILVICAVGVYSVLRWVFSQLVKLKSPKKKFIRIGHERKLVCYDDLPEANKYKGRTWLGGLPVFADVVVPDKHNYSTIIYMDHPTKQWVYDWVASWKAVANNKSNPYGTFALLCFLTLPFFFGAVVGVACLSIVALLFIFGAPSGKRAVRRGGELAKNFTPETWAKIYDDVVKDLAEEERLVSALRRSGTARWW